MHLQKPKQALLIGAGFSRDFGMPLAWDLTKEITDHLTPDKFRSLKNGWRAQGQGGCGQGAGRSGLAPIRSFDRQRTAERRLRLAGVRFRDCSQTRSLLTAAVTEPACV
jgi:hypothetical protein